MKRKGVEFKGFTLKTSASFLLKAYSEQNFFQLHHAMTLYSRWSFFKRCLRWIFGSSHAPALCYLRPIGVLFWNFLQILMKLRMNTTWIKSTKKFRARNRQIRIYVEIVFILFSTKEVKIVVLFCLLLLRMLSFTLPI